jgi:magnesium transporter
MIEAVVYDDGHVDRYDAERLAAARAAPGTTWVRATAASESELRRVAETFGVHELAVEDVVNGVRPKVEEFPDHTFVLVKTARLRRGETTFEEEISDDTLGVAFGDDWVVTLATTTIAPVDRVWSAVDREEPRLLSRGPDFTAYRVLDLVVEEYFAIVDEIEDDIERVEDEVMATPEIDTLEQINSLRRELLSTRRIVWPTRDAASTLARGDPDQVRQETEKYYRDLYDHLVQIVDLVETYRDLTSGARDIYLNRLSQSTNDVMKTLTVVATIILPLTFVAGVYGMNFDPGGGALNMPELTWQYGYPAAMLGMASIAAVMLAYFRRRDWV